MKPMVNIDTSIENAIKLNRVLEILKSVNPETALAILEICRIKILDA